MKIKAHYLKETMILMAEMSRGSESSSLGVNHMTGLGNQQTPWVFLGKTQWLCREVVRGYSSGPKDRYIPLLGGLH